VAKTLEAILDYMFLRFEVKRQKRCRVEKEREMPKGKRKKKGRYRPVSVRSTLEKEKGHERE